MSITQPASITRPKRCVGGESDGMKTGCREHIAIRFNSQIDNASVTPPPLGTRGNLTTEVLWRFASLTGFDD